MNNIAPAAAPNAPATETPANASAPVETPTPAPVSESTPAAAPETQPTPEAPAPAPEDYAFDPPEALKPYFSKADDPAMASARAAAAELGLTPAQFSGMIEKTFGPLVEQGALPPAFDAAAELRALGTDWGYGDDPAGRAALSRELNGVLSFAEGFAASAGLDASSAAELVAMADTAAGAKALRAIQKAIGGDGGPTPGGTPAAAVSLGSLIEQMSDPRYDPNASQYSREFRRDLDQRIQQHPDSRRG